MDSFGVHLTNALAKTWFKSLIKVANTYEQGVGETTNLARSLFYNSSLKHINMIKNSSR